MGSCVTTTKPVVDTTKLVSFFLRGIMMNISVCLLVITMVLQSEGMSLDRESGCSAPSGMSCCEDSMTIGDARGGSEEIIRGSYTLDECITECKKRPGVNGITVESSVTSLTAGPCWCETGITELRWKGRQSYGYKTCYLSGKPSSTLPPHTTTTTTTTTTSPRKGCKGCSEESPVTAEITNIATTATSLLAATSAGAGCSQLNLVEVVSAETQVVAGTNYILSLKLATNCGTNCGTTNIVVHKPLPDDCQADDGCLEIISQEDISCTEPQAQVVTPLSGCGTAGDGIVSGDGTSCCPPSCGTCGGSGCKARPGGIDCCAGPTRAAGLPCSTNPAPCLMDTALGSCIEQTLSSWNYAYFETELEGLIASMEVKSKISRSGCTLGTSYGFDGSNGWVDKGCRADFIFCFKQGGSISPNCDESTWPDKDHDLVCGECKVLVDNMDDKYGTCTAYCNAVGRTCVGAWEEKWDTCKVKSTKDCSDNFGAYTSDAICECGDRMI